MPPLLPCSPWPRRQPIALPRFSVSRVAAAWRGLVHLWALGLVVVELPYAAGARLLAQAPPSLPAPPPPVSACVGRYGYTGCAGRLYARVLCEIVGRTVDLPAIEARLQAQFVAEQIDFKGIDVAEVEAVAVRYYVPQICPDKQQQIWSLLLPPQAG
jgi:hypothetical protein